jgi:hypothetical protein
MATTQMYEGWKEMSEGEFKKRIGYLKWQYRGITYIPHELLFKVLDEGRKDILAELGNFEYYEPCDYNHLPQLQIRYEEASRKLLSVTNKVLKWFGCAEK